MAKDFDFIQPGEQDFFEFDFADMLGPNDTIESCTNFICAVAPNSPVDDPDAGDRVLTDPSITSTTVYAKVGDMLDGCVYLLTCLIHTQLDRHLELSAEVPCREDPQVLPVVPAVPPVPGQAVFDYNGWIRAFPEFANIEPDEAQNYWFMAEGFLANDGTGPIRDPAQQSRAMHLLTAHIAALFSPTLGKGAGDTVGRISSRAVGPVSVSSELPGNFNANSAWYALTKYGLLYWTLMAPYRTFRYIPGRPRGQRIIGGRAIPWPY